MPTLLAVGVSPRHEYSTSRKLTALFVENWKAAHRGGKVIERDLMKTDLPFLDMAWKSPVSCRSNLAGFRKADC